MAQRVVVDIIPCSKIGTIDRFLYSGFLEHLGRCIYGGIVPALPTTFPYTASSPCPPSEFEATPDTLVDEDGFRTDVLAVLRDELKVGMVRWPGGNYVSSYNWLDGVGPIEERKRRVELAWNGEECNHFGTNEFVAWCRKANCEPYIIFNMGTGTLQDALNWLEYCNGTGETYYANLRRKHTGKKEPHNVIYWGLGNEVWGEWQVGQQSAPEYAKKARQWAHALKLMDPKIKLISCGETGLTNWDDIVLDECADKVWGHSIHLYTGFGPRNRQETEKEYSRGVYGPDAAEFGIDICRSLIKKSRSLKGVEHDIKIAFDEWGVWDETVGTAENGLQQIYDFKDALAIAAWLNVFVRASDTVSIACIAQSVNVISPLLVSNDKILKQATFYPLFLFAQYFSAGSTAVRVEVEGDDRFKGETLPTWIGKVRGAPREMDSSASLAEDGKKLAVSIINRAEATTYEAEVRIGHGFHIGGKVKVLEMWNQDVNSKNDWGSEKVGYTETEVEWNGNWTFKAHSFTIFVFSKK